MKSGAVIILLVMGLLAFLFLWLFKLGFENVWRGYSSSSWPVTEGLVVSADPSSSGSNINNRPTTAIHRLTLGIRYHVGGRAYSTEQISWGQTLGTSDPSDAALLGLRYRTGQTVQVRYDPDNPAEAVLIPGLHASAFLLPASALALLALVAPGVAFGWSSLSADAVESGAESSGLMMWSIRLVLLVFLIFGSGLLVAGFRDVSYAIKSHAWPTTSGEWVQRQREDFDGPAPPGHVPAPEARIGVEYVYRYAVKGTQRFNNMRSFGQGPAGGSRSDEEIAAHFPRGRSLQVYYDPTDPDQSTLVPGISPRVWILPGIGMVLLLIGTLVFARWNKSSRKHSGAASVPQPGTRGGTAKTSPPRSGKRRGKTGR